ncbi:hypothetical protein BH11MYX4_BH11MYX4_34890 [soil metagenome]
MFGNSIAAWGDTVAVGATGESSAATGVNGDATNTGALDAGAVFVFRRTGGVWAQEAYLKASNTKPLVGAQFGRSIALFGDTLVVGAPYEASGTSSPNDTSANGAGAAYVFTRTGTTWTQQAYLKASTPQASAFFGVALALSGDTLAIGATHERLASIVDAGAVHIYTRTSGVWTEQGSALRAGNPTANEHFGTSVSVSGDAVAVGGPDHSEPGVLGCGAAWIFTRSGTAWSQPTQILASNARAAAHFGFSIAVSGNTVAVGSTEESSGVIGDPKDVSAGSAGAVYVFSRAGAAWAQTAYLKASKPRFFGRSVALAKDVVAVGSVGESSGITGNQTDTSQPNAGAAYVF